MTDQASLLRAKMGGVQPLSDFESRDGNARIIAVGSGKGGVGKSNFCVNFGLALVRQGVKVLVIDTDVGFANVEVLLNVTPRHSLVDVLHGRKMVDLVEQTPSGLAFISGGNGLFEPTTFNDTDFGFLIEELHSVCSMFDVVLLDCSAGLTEVSRQIVFASDELILVTTPEPTAMTDAYAFMKMLIQHKELPPTRVLINRATTFTDARQAAETLIKVAIKFLSAELGVLGYILEDSMVGEAVMKQIPLLSYAVRSKSASCYEQVALNFLRQDLRTPKTGITGFFDRLLKLRRYRQNRGSEYTA